MNNLYYFETLYFNKSAAYAFMNPIVKNTLQYDTMKTFMDANIGMVKVLIQKTRLILQQ